MINKYKTHNCGELRISDVGKEVRVEIIPVYDNVVDKEIVFLKGTAFSIFYKIFYCFHKQNLKMHKQDAQQGGCGTPQEYYKSR